MNHSLLLLHNFAIIWIWSTQVTYVRCTHKHCTQFLALPYWIADKVPNSQHSKLRACHPNTAIFIDIIVIDPMQKLPFPPWRKIHPCAYKVRTVNETIVKQPYRVHESGTVIALQIPRTRVHHWSTPRWPAPRRRGLSAFHFELQVLRQWNMFAKVKSDLYTSFNVCAGAKKWHWICNELVSL